MATKSALKLADYVVTEAGFGADLGAEKFFDLKCRKTGLQPDCAVIVATIRALKMHGGVGKDALKAENVSALETGFSNLARHVANVRKYGVPVIVAVNRFSSDTDNERGRLIELCKGIHVECIMTDHWAEGGPGAADLARAVAAQVDSKPSAFRMLYPDDMPLWDKVRTIARELYGADEITAPEKLKDRFKELQDRGFGNLPVCIAKTQYSFTTDPDSHGAPSHHEIPIRDIRLSAGAEFVVVICGEIMTMPGLPKISNASRIDVLPDGRITGLS
jgi:formate--tetrahydrofolate ligase